FSCPPTLEMNFREPTGRVALWYGLQLQLGAEGTVNLTLFDAAGAVVGATSQVRNAGDGPAPVDTHLEVRPDRPAAKAIVSTGGGLSPCALVMDDVEFDWYAPPADLALEAASAAFSGASMTVTVTVRNVGGTASTPTSLSA